MNVFHSLCPLCHIIHDGLCTTCLDLILEEKKSSYMKKVCPRCGTLFLSLDCVCSCKTLDYHYVVFDDSIVIKTLLQSIIRPHSNVLISQIGTIIVDEISKICHINPVYVYHVEQKSIYKTFFDQLVLYINSHLLEEGDTLLCVCLKGQKGRKSISLIE